MLELRKVSKYYGETPAVQDLSFTVKEGEIFGLIGTSGCGKTTTLKMINRLIEPTSGSILMGGRDISVDNPPQLRRHIGYVIQDVGLFPHYSVQQNISIVPKLLGWDDNRISSRCQELLQLVGLDPQTFADRKPNSLSGGQQQRVGLARALAADPPVILMDEPFGALDPITKQHIRKEVSRLFARINKTIVLVTHDIFEAFEMCDRLCLLDDGKLQQMGTPAELIFNPAKEFVDQFFASDRFQLELLGVTLSDILPFADASEEIFLSPSQMEQDIPRDTSLYAVIDDMGRTKEADVKLIHKIDGRVVDSMSLPELLSAFQHYKKSMSGGGGYG